MSNTKRTIPQSPNYQEMVSGVLRLHRYTVEGRDKTPEYHELCATMESFSGQLTALETERVGGLSEDLYTVSDPPPSKLEPMTLENQNDLAAAYEAKERGEWDLILPLLRKLDKSVQPHQLAYFRGTVWEGIGDKHVAAVFYERAYRLVPTNQFIRTVFLSALKWTDGKGAREMAESVLVESGTLDPILVTEAADVVYEQTTGLPEHETAPIYRRLVDVLTPLFARATAEKGPNYPPLCIIAIRLATCHRWLGEIREAYHFYSQALLLEPSNDAILTARGIIVYGLNQTAIADFEQAIKLESRMVWPYYYMAHYLLGQSRFEECRRMCERALEWPAPERIQSDLWQFLGIAMYWLNYPVEIVRQAFEYAVRIDPSSERARENLQKFLAAIETKPHQPIAWDRPSESSVRTAGRQQMKLVEV